MTAVTHLRVDTTAEFVDGPFQRTVENLGPDTLYYSTSEEVSASDSSVAAGAETTFSAAYWVVSAGRSRLIVTELSESSAESTVGNGYAVLGDSITSGGDTTGLFWSEMVPMLTKGRARRVVVAGIAGNTTAQMLARIQADVIAYAPNVCLVMGGTNDATAANAISNLPLIYARLRAANIEPIACTITPSNSDPGGKVKAINAWIQSYCGRNRIQVLDMHAQVVDATNSQYLTGYASDAVHPTNKGHRVMAEYAAPLVADRLPLWMPYLSTSAPDTGNLQANPLMLSPRLLGDGITPVTEDPLGYSSSPPTGTSRSRATVTGVPGKMHELTMTTSAAASASIGVTATGYNIACVAGHRMAFAARIQSSGCEEALVGVHLDVYWNGGVYAGGLGGNLLTGNISDGVWYQEFVVPTGKTGAKIEWSLRAGASAPTQTAILRIGQVTVIDLTALGLT